MNNSIMYHTGNRRLQDQFNSRRISDRLEEKLTHSQFTEGDKTIVESAAYFFWRQPMQKGGPTAPLRAECQASCACVGPSELAFPDYDGNGMFKSLGNILVNPNVGMLFIAMHDKPQRLRLMARRQ